MRVPKLVQADRIVFCDEVNSVCNEDLSNEGKKIFNRNECFLLRSQRSFDQRKKC